MEKHLRLIATAETISPLLAIQSLMMGESPFDAHDDTFTMKVESLAPGRDTRYVMDEQGTCFLMANNVHDKTKITLVHPCPPAFELYLKCLGMKGSELVIDAEALSDRITAIDSAWSLINYLRRRANDDKPVASAVRLIGMACEWSELRLQAFNDKLRSDQTLRFEELEREIASIPDWPGLRQC